MNLEIKQKEILQNNLENLKVMGFVIGIINFIKIWNENKIKMIKMIKIILQFNKKDI